MTSSGCDMAADALFADPMRISGTDLSPKARIASANAPEGSE